MADTRCVMLDICCLLSELRCVMSDVLYQISNDICMICQTFGGRCLIDIDIPACDVRPLISLCLMACLICRISYDRFGIPDV